MKPKAQVEYRPIKDLKELPGNPRVIKKTSSRSSPNGAYFRKEGKWPEVKKI